MKDFRADLTDIFAAAVDRADPERLVRENVYTDGGGIMIGSGFVSRKSKIFMFAFGKAACGMAKGFLSAVPVEKGVVASNSVENFPENIEMIRASHPLPDEGSMRAAERMLELAGEADEDTLCVFLVSGGGSALLCAPGFGITLDEKRRTFDLLIKSGADIEEINTVRRHISGVKGGRLAAAAGPAEVVTLAVSDVLYNAENAIASGATYPDETTWDDALEVIYKYGLARKIPGRVMQVLKEGADGEHPDTLKDRGEDYNFITLCANRDGMKAAAEKAYEMGYKVRVHGQMSCDVSEAADIMVSRLKEHLISLSIKKPVCMIFGGEVTVKVRGSGKGGRCQQLALEYFLREKPVETYALCASTDGMDGPTDAAGAFTDDLMDGTDADAYAENNDAYNFFHRNSGLLITGLTGTNINDLYIVIIPETNIEFLMVAMESAQSLI